MRVGRGLDCELYHCPLIRLNWVGVFPIRGRFSRAHDFLVFELRGLAV